jgi:hypothetical protein
MNKSESIASLAKALSAAQGSIKSALKDSNNPFFKSKYADLASVWESCRPALSSNGLAVTQSTAFVGELLVLETMLMHLSGEWVSSVYPISPVKSDPQGVGSAITYARRYSLSALVGVVAGEDDDGNAASRPAHVPPKKTDNKEEPYAARSPQQFAAKPIDTPKWLPQQSAEVNKLFAQLTEEDVIKFKEAHRGKPPSETIDALNEVIKQLNQLAQKG